MNKAIKMTALTLSILLLLGVVAFISLITLVSPNHFKPLIIEEVKKNTGRELAIDGDLSWTIFPYLGVKIGHLELSNPKEFQQKTFAEMDNATLGVKIIPLLRGRIESNGLSLKGLKLYLIKDANGNTNWEMTEKEAEQASPVSTNKTDNKNTINNKSFVFAIAGIDIKDAALFWINEQAKQTVNIEHFNLQAKNVSLAQAVPFKITFDVAGKTPQIVGKISLVSKISADPEKQIYNFQDTILTGILTQNQQHFDINLKSNIVANLSQDTLRISNILGQVANIKLAGKVDVTHVLSKPQTSGHLTIRPFDSKKLLQILGKDVAALQVLNQVKGNFDFTTANDLRSLDLKGVIKIDELQASDVRMTQINIPTQLKNGVLILSPVTANFYQGNLNGLIRVNLNTPTPRIVIQAKAQNIQAEPLFKDLASKSKFKLTGTGNMELDVTTFGNSEDMVKNLNGASKLAFNNGVIQGIDIGYLLNTAYSLAGKKSVSDNSNTNQTPFGTLSASSIIRNGVISNQDLYFNSPQFDTRGSGSIDLVKQLINYQLRTTGKEADKNNLNNMYGLPIPIVIAGDLYKPSISLDTSALMKAIAQQHLKKAGIQLDEKLKGKIPDEAAKLINNFLGR